MADIANDDTQDIDLNSDNSDSYIGRRLFRPFTREYLLDSLNNIDLYNSTRTNQLVDGPPSVNNQNSYPAVTNVASTDNNSSNTSTTGSQYSLYVGNLTWWTTDQDVSDRITSIGVSDLIEVKFFEHQDNGTSKGICAITLGSEHSLRLVRDELPKKELNGKLPVVGPPTQKVLEQFESYVKSLQKYFYLLEITKSQNEPIMGGMSRSPGQNMQQPMRGGTRGRLQGEDKVGHSNF